MQDYKRLLKYVRPYWLTFVTAIIAMILVAVFETATSALLMPIIYQFVPATGPMKEFQELLHQIIPQDDWYRGWLVISGLLLTFTILKGIAEYFSAYLMAKIGQAAVLNLRHELYDHLLRQSATFFENHRSNFLVSRLVVSCAAIELAVSSNLRDVLRETVILTGFLAAGFYLNWRLMLGAIVLAPIIGFLTSKFSRALRKFAEESFEGNKLLTDTAQETLSSQTVVKAYGAEEREIKRFDQVAGIIAKANLRSGRIAAISPPTIETIGMLALSVLLYFGLREINNGTMDAAEFFTFMVMLFRSYDPMRKISRQHNEISKAFAAAKDIWSVLDEDLRIPEKLNATELKPLSNEIKLNSLKFEYKQDGKTVLNGVDLTIKKGSMVALVGESGGGKSSVTKLVQRLYDPTGGSITWDRIDLRDATLASLRENIALVTQETILFNESVKYNISYGKPDATDQEIKTAAEVAFAADFIDELTDKYDTLVGERGTMLSGGQRQRIAIARAVLMDAPVLILDEATSALDTESERLVQMALANLMAGRTSIVIAHRLSTIRRADLIVVMERGSIKEMGSHQELIEKGGKYKRLYELQFAEEQEETDQL